MRTMLVLAFAFMVGCDFSEPVSGKSMVGIYITTHEHDGHKFVVVSSGNAQGGASVMHHPDCPCQVKR